MEQLKARRARYGKLDRPLPQALQAALRGIGASKLYSHQAQAINAARAGQHVILSTGTASGKTLAYNVPVLEALLTAPRPDPLPVPHQGAGPGSAPRATRAGPE